MNKKMTGIFSAFGLAGLLIGCGSSTAQWDEDVEINTGEIIVVHRVDRFAERVSSGANGIGTSYQPAGRSYAFAWKGKQYVYSDDTDKFKGALLISVDPVAGAVSIVDWNDDCAKKGYVEYKWESNQWKMQQEISPRLIGAPRNLMAYWSSVNPIPAHVDQLYKYQRDTSPNSRSALMSVDPKFVAMQCRSK
jgi:hypothetical protein